ncbi:MAG: hypothetical protein KAS32_06010 [Candidatus Peribacteraceae bacterium]|nr:hypothetical protein [Candidatus Peribacteraceae bacterium]
MSLLTFSDLLKGAAKEEPECKSCPFKYHFDNGEYYVRNHDTGNAIRELEKSSKELESQKLECCGMLGSGYYVLKIREHLNNLYVEKLFDDISSEYEIPREDIFSQVLNVPDNEKNDTQRFLTVNQKLNEFVKDNENEPFIEEYDRKMLELKFLHYKGKFHMLSVIFPTDKTETIE